MKLYLSSFGVGERARELQQLASGKCLGFVPNALDHVAPDGRVESNDRAMSALTDLGIDVEMLDLGAYFGEEADLASDLRALGGVWVRGGNTYVLRQAMRLSGFDVVVHDLPNDFLYGGYSAGCCVLAPRLDGIQHVDDPSIAPYAESDVIWEGLGILDYLILPHYRSDHPESADIETEVEYCREHGIEFRTLRDGEVIVSET